MLIFGRLSLTNLIYLCRVLRHKLGAGIMLRDTFRQEALKAPGAVRNVSQRISQVLEEGDSLEMALQREQKTFPPLFLSLAVVGEQTGNMPEIFGEMEKYYRLQQKFWNQFRAQCTLPIITLVFGIFVIAAFIFILGFLGSKMDPLGLGLTGTAGAILFLVYCFGFLAVLVFGYLWLNRFVEQKAAVDRALLSIPAVGPFLQALCLWRFSLALRLTLNTGMSIVKALALCLKGTGNAAFGVSTRLVQETLRSGNNLTAALTRTRLFPDDYLQMVAVGEQGGDIPEIMEKLATQYEEEAQHRLTVLTKVAGFLVWFIVACFLVSMIFRIFTSTVAPYYAV
jgi:type II secretory pathway component PulF